MKLRFTVDGPPVGKGRPEATVIRVGGRYVAKLRTPKRTVAYEARCRATALAHLPGAPEPFAGRVALLARIYHPHTPGSKPDGSNVLKAVEDSMNAAVYRDDRQVQVGAFVVSVDPDRPRVEVAVESIPTAACILCGHALAPLEVP